MTRRATSSEEPLSWQGVLDAATWRDGERAFLRRLLEFLCQTHDLEAAALYSPADEAFRCQVAWGGAAFPAAIEASAIEGYGLVELPHGLLLYQPGGDSPRDVEGPLLMALTAGLQAVLLRQKLKRQNFVVGYRGVELEALYDVGLAIASTLNLEQLGDEILQRAVALLDARRGALYLRSEGKFRLDRTLGGDARHELPRDDPQIGGLLNEGLTEAQDLLPGAGYLMAVPIGSLPEPEGLLVVADKESRHGVGPFPEADRRTLSLFANQAAIALENAYLHRQALEKERLERELDLAAQIQRRLLPTVFPRIEGFELAGWSRPARHVGGDFYDLVRSRGSRLAAVLADVSGKGLPAALMVSTIHSAVRLLIDQEEVGPGLVRHLNHHICESSAPNKFITLLLAELDPERSEVLYVNAGHNSGLLIRHDGQVEELRSGGLPLGLFAESSFVARRVAMEPGDLLCVYSDGITECESPSEEEFGAHRLVELLRARSHDSLSQVLRAVESAVTDFARGLSQGDDQTVVLLRRSPSSG
jgi:sigma-B regulation protein RsbU (phosphoserine phosphatase)